MSNEPKLKKRVQGKTISPRNAEEGQEKKIKEKNDESTKISQRQNVTTLGDSILNGLSEQGLRKEHNVKVRAHRGETSHDIKDHIRQNSKKKA